MSDVNIKVTLQNYDSTKTYWVSVDGQNAQQGTSGTFTLPEGTNHWARGSDGYGPNKEEFFTASYEGQEVVVDMGGG